MTKNTKHIAHIKQRVARITERKLNMNSEKPKMNFLRKIFSVASSTYEWNKENMPEMPGIQ